MVRDFNGAQVQDEQVLYLLEKLGYPMELIGTILYKELILHLINELESDNDYGSDIEEKKIFLCEDVKKYFSHTYHDVARNDNDIGIRSFHSYIEEMLGRIDYLNADEELVKKIYGAYDREIDYGENALILALYSLGRHYSNSLDAAYPKIKKIKYPSSN